MNNLKTLDLKRETTNTSGTTRPRIAVACSGLGHIFRGVETWAIDLARSLHNAGQNVTLFQGTGESSEAWQQIVNCMKRTDVRAEKLSRRLVRLGGWKYGVGSGYQWEQSTFALKLWPQVRRDFDIVHTQDPWVALHLERLRRRGMSRPHVILAHGTEEPTAYLQKFAVLQHLAPCYLEAWEASKPVGQQAFAIGNFVCTDRFAPGNREDARKAWDLPEDALIGLSVAAIKKKHKRVDYLLREFAAFEARIASERKQRALLVVAGGREPETEEVMQLGRELLGDKARFLTEVSREKMPSLYQAADIFALASEHEMMPIALLEALASGLPIACNDTPTLRWMTGPAGTLTDITKPGALTEQLMAFREPQVRARFGSRARFYAENTFSEPVILREINAMYEAVMERK